MRIVFVLPDASAVPIGGYRVVYEYAKGLSALGHEVRVLHPWTVGSLSNVRYGRSMIARTLRARGWRVDCAPWFTQRAGARFLRVADGSRRSFPDADVVVATAWQTASVVAALPKACGRKFYLIQHLETWAGPQRDVMATWRLELHKIVIARWLEGIAEKLGEASRTTYIPNGMDISRFRLTRPVTDRRACVLMLSHELEWKGTDDGIAALNLARQKHAHLKAIVFGTRNRPSALPEWIQYKQLPSVEELVGLYNECAIFLHSSWMEGWPLPPAEAMLCGCAVVAAANDGVCDYAEHEANALLAPVRRADLLGQALCRLLEDNELRIALATEGHRRMQQYTWERATAAFINVLSDDRAVSTYTDNL